MQLLPDLLKLSLSEFLSAYDIVIWGLKMKIGVVSMTNNALLVFVHGAHTVPLHAIMVLKRSKL